MSSKKIFNPKTKNYINDTPVNRKRIHNISKSLKTVLNELKEKQVKKNMNNVISEVKQVGRFNKKQTKKQAIVEKHRKYSYSITPLYLVDKARRDKMRRAQIITINGKDYYKRFDSEIHILNKRAKKEHYGVGEFMNNKFNNDLQYTIGHEASKADLVLLEDETPVIIEKKKNPLKQRQHASKNISISNKYLKTEIKEGEFVDNVNISVLNGCWYNLIITVFGEAFAKFGKELNEKYLREVFEITDENETGVSIEEASKFFIRNRLSLLVLDGYHKEIFYYKPEKENTNYGRRGVKVMVWNNHVYLLDNNLKSLEQVGGAEDEIKVNDELNTKLNEEEVDVFKTNTKEETLRLILSTKKAIIIYQVEDLKQLVAKLVLINGITPRISASGTKNNGAIIKSISLNVVVDKDEFKIQVNSLGSIPFSNPDDILNITSENMKQMIKDERRMKKALSEIPISYYSNDLIKVFKQSEEEKLPLVHKWFEGNKDGLNIVDINKSYPDTLMNYETLPLFDLFDTFEVYQGEEICECFLYQIKIENMDEVEKVMLFGEGKTFYQTGSDLLALDGLVKSQIHVKKYLRPYKVIKNPFKEIIKEILSNENQVPILRKFVINKFIGAMGKRFNKVCISKISTDKQDLINGENKVLNLNTNKEPIYFRADNYEKELINGYYPLQYSIYSYQRVKLYQLYRKVNDLGINVLACKVDAIYFGNSRKNVDAIETLKNESSTQIGKFKFETNKMI